MAGIFFIPPAVNSTGLYLVGQTFACTVVYIKKTLAIVNTGNSKRNRPDGLRLGKIPPQRLVQSLGVSMLTVTPVLRCQNG